MDRRGQGTVAHRIGPLMLFSLITLISLKYSSAYIAYQGQFHWHRTEATRDYFDQVDNVVESFDEYCQAASQNKDGKRLKRNTIISQELVNGFLDEWRLLAEIRREALDFQLLEYLGEPTVTNQYLAELELDVVPVLEKGARLRSSTNHCCSWWKRPWRVLVSWRQARKHQRESKKRIRRFNQRRAMARRNPVLLSTRFPFEGSDALRNLSEEARDEYHRLIRDHQELLEEGSRFASMDPSHKASYVRSLKRIEDRWDVALSRFRLMGALSPQFLEERLAYLAGFGMDEERYTKHLETNRRKLRLGIHTVFRIDEEEEPERESVASRRIIPFRAAGRKMAS